MYTRLLIALLVSTTMLPLAARAQVTPNPERCSIETRDFCLNGVSNAVTAFDSLRVSSVSSRGLQDNEDEKEGKRGKRKRAGDGTILIAASEKVPLFGGADEPWAVWASVGRSRFASSVTVAPYTAELETMRVGVDRLFAGRYVLGVAMLSEHVTTRTKYNGGGQTVDGTVMVPYLSVLLGNTFSLDLNAGFGRGKANQDRVDPSLAAPVGTILRANYRADREFLSATLNAFLPRGNWTFGGRVGYLHSKEDQTGFQETGGPSARNVQGREVKLGQVFAGLDAAYRFANNWEPNASLVYRRDVSRNDGRAGGGLPGAVGATQPDDRTEWEWSAGLRFFGERGMTLGAEFLKTRGRESFKNESFNLTARFEF